VIESDVCAILFIFLFPLLPLTSVRKLQCASDNTNQTLFSLVFQHCA